MDKNKSNATILGVFLIVSLIIIFMLCFVLVSGDYVKKDDVTITDINESEYIDEARKSFENTYNYVNNVMFNYIDSVYDVVLNKSYCSNYTFSEDDAKNYFSSRAIKNIENQLVFDDVTYYDCYDYRSSLLTSSIFRNDIVSRDYKFISGDDVYMVIEVDGVDGNGTNYSNLINLIKINNIWLIDSFE